MVYNLTGGGAERVASLWANGFAQSGHAVTVITEISDDKQFTYDISSKVKINPISINNTIFRRLIRVLGLYHLQFKYRLRRLLIKLKPDICIGVMGKYALDAYKCSRDLNCKIINTEHNAYDRPGFFKERPDIIKMKYQTNKLFDCVTVLTEADTKVPGVPLDNIFVLPNPLAYTPTNIIPNKDKTILAVGRLDVWEVKGFDVLINAWGSIAVRYPDWKLIIAGTGSEKSKRYLQKLANNYNLKSQIEFVGFCNDIYELYRSSSIFVLSSRYEGFGLVLVEAMSQGCACIACDFNGRQKEIIQNDTQGIICETGDVSALIRAIKKMIEDDLYRENCRVQAVERAKFYTIENIMERWSTIFKKIDLKC